MEENVLEFILYCKINAVKQMLRSYATNCEECREIRTLVVGHFTYHLIKYRKTSTVVLR